METTSIYFQWNVSVECFPVLDLKNLLFIFCFYYLIILIPNTVDTQYEIDFTYFTTWFAFRCACATRILMIGPASIDCHFTRQSLFDKSRASRPVTKCPKHIQVASCFLRCLKANFAREKITLVSHIEFARGGTHPYAILVNFASLALHLSLRIGSEPSSQISRQLSVWSTLKVQLMHDRLHRCQVCICLCYNQCYI